MKTLNEFNIMIRKPAISVLEGIKSDESEAKKYVICILSSLTGLPQNITICREKMRFFWQVAIHDLTKLHLKVLGQYVKTFAN